MRKLQARQIQNKSTQDFPGGPEVKSPPASAGDTGSSPGPGRPPQATEQLSPRAPTTEPTQLDRSPHSAQLQEGLCSDKDTEQPKKN